MAATSNASRLDEIVDHTRAQVCLRKGHANLNAMEHQAAAHTPRGFLRALRERSQTGPAVIAELKRASPSKGNIREELDSAAMAMELEASGAAALSVLTEEKWFRGSLADLRAASQATRLPCLRKDFMVNDFQVLEARAHGADAILLIAAALHDSELKQLASAAHAFALDVLCEVHDAEELHRVLALALPHDHTAIGVNARNLHSFNVSLDDSIALAERARVGGYLLVAESGIHSAADITRLRDAGYQAFLIGEALMRAPSPGEFLRTLLSSCG